MEELKEEIKGVFVTPTGDFNCQVFPIIEGKKYFITDEELERLGKHELKWHYEEETVKVEVDDLEKPIYDETEIIIGYEKKLVDKAITVCSLIPNDNTQEKMIENAKKEITEIHKWLYDNDWKVNKIVIGEWETTDTRWLEYLNERAVKRARLDELSEMLNIQNIEGE